MRSIVLFILAASAATHAQPCAPYWAAVPGSNNSTSAVPFDDGTGMGLFVAGYVWNGSTWGRRAARWRNGEWEPLLEGLPTSYSDALLMLVLDDGNGPALYCRGNQLIIGEGTRPWLRRWNGLEWVATPPGMTGEYVAPSLSWDDGSGSALYGFDRIGGRWYPVRWNGAGWEVIGTLSALGSYLMDVVEDGTGERLYMFGTFTRTGTNESVNVARWDGTDWEKIGDITGGKAVRGIVSAVHNGQRWLYVAEYHNITGQGPVGRIMRWDGQTWSPLPGGGIANIGINAVHKLAVYDDGRGEALYIAGLFTMAGGLPVRNIVRFDGTNYEALGDGIGTWTEDMVVHDDGRGEALFVIGSFSYVSGGRAGGIAQWVGCPNCYANCDLSAVSPALNIDDFTCFINKFAAEDPYANCNLDAVLDISDFMCFIDRFAAGCP